MGKSYDADPAALSQDGRIAAVCEAEREIARLQGRQLRLIAALAEDPCADSPAPELEKEYIKEELRAALGESALSVNARLALAQTLTTRLSRTLVALEAGTVTLRHVRHLVDALIGLDEGSARDVEAAVLDFAGGRDLSAFCRKVRREVLKLDSRTVEERLATALADRRVWAQPVDDAMTCFGALLPADGAQTLLIALDLMAAQCPPTDPRSADQRRADALVQLGIDALNGFRTCSHCAARSDYQGGATNLPRWQGRRPSVNVTVALSTLLGLDEQPGELDGYGPVPAALARRLASEDGATWRRLVTDDLGRLVDYGRATYRPPADLRDYVLARDRTCMFPTCNRAACRCEIDHITARVDGGRTNADNLAVLCCRHHHTKHDAGWRLRRLPDGGIEWTSPTGHSYVVPATTYPVDTTSSTYARNDNEEHPETETDSDPPSAQAA